VLDNVAAPEAVKVPVTDVLGAG